MLITERQDAVLLLTLNRPDRRNSLHPDLLHALQAAVDRAADDETLTTLRGCNQQSISNR